MKVTPATLYTRRMVPLGQTLELLHRAVRYSVRLPGVRRFTCDGQTRRTAEEVYQAFRGPILDMLHLINCAMQAELLNGGLPGKVVAVLDDRLYELQSQMTDLLHHWATSTMGDKSLQVALKKALDTHMSRPVATSLQNSFIERVAKHRELSRPLVEMVWGLLSYTPATRNAWLASRIKTTTGAPLMRNGKAGYWLTLVENMSWDPTYALLGVNLAAPARAGSPQGRDRLPVLLATLPGYTIEVANHQELKSPGAVRIPEDVTVSVESGYLVLARHVPTPVEAGKVSDVAAWGEYCKKQLVAPQTKKDRKVSVTCGADNLVKGLDALQRLTALKVDGDVKLLAAFEQNLRDSQRAATVDKLKQHFNPDEMQQLAEYFANRK